MDMFFGPSELKHQGHVEPPLNMDTWVCQVKSRLLVGRSAADTEADHPQARAAEKLHSPIFLIGMPGLEYCVCLARLAWICQLMLSLCHPSVLA